jgi:hypothetical protein
LDGGAWQQALYFQVREYKPDWHLNMLSDSCRLLQSV